MENNNKLLKLNGEYVKLYITTNSTLPKLLKNSGSLVVYHDNNKAQTNNYLNSTLIYTSDDIKSKDNIEIVDSINESIKKYAIISKYSNLYANDGNYLYLGNELISSGWGFDNETQKNIAIQHLTLLPEYLLQINTELKEEEVELQKVRDNLNLYVSKGTDIASEGEGGNNLFITGSHFNIDGINRVIDDEAQIPLYILPRLFYKAKYDQEVIRNIDHTCSLQYIYENNDTNHTLKLKPIPENDINKYVIRDDTNKCFYIPMHSALSSYSLNISYENRDSGGIGKVRYKGLVNIDNDNNIQYSDINLDQTVVNLEPTQEIYNNNIHDVVELSNCKFTKSWLLDTQETNALALANIISMTSYNEKIYPLKNLSIIVNETKNYKPYPYLSDSEISNLKSIENIIKEHEINIDPYCIIPKYLFYGMDPKELDLSNIDKNDFNVNPISESNFDISQLIINPNKLIIENIFKNTIPEKHKPYLLVYCIPSIYNIDKITLRTTDINISRNITGDFKIIKSYNLSSNPYEYNSQTLIKYNIIYTVLEFNYEDTNNIYNIEFNLSENSPKSDENNIVSNINLLDSYYYTYHLSNDEFDSTHWFTGYIDNYFLNIVKKLDPHPIDYIGTYANIKNRLYPKNKNSIVLRKLIL